MSRLFDSLRCLFRSIRSLFSSTIATSPSSVSNGAAYISVADADDCKQNHTAGYSLEVVFEVNGQQRVAGPACHLTAAIGSLTETYSKTFTAPTSGEVEVSAWVRLPGSGSETDPMTRHVTVSSDDPTEAPPAADLDSGNYPWLNDDGDGSTSDDSNNTSNGGFFASLFGGGGGGSGPLGQVQGLMAMVVVVMLIGVVMQSGAVGGASS